MIRAAIALLTTAATTAALAIEPAAHAPATPAPEHGAEAGHPPDADPAPSPVPAPPRGSLPGFAPALAEMPIVTGPAGWPTIPEDAAWEAIISADADGRQPARWRYATSLIGSNKGSNALGVLDVMVADDPDLRLVPAWRRARGVAAAMMGHDRQAIDDLSDGALLGDPESCVWRLLSLARTGQDDMTLRQLRCAMPALTVRDVEQRRPFVLTIARSAITLGRAGPALEWLRSVADRDPEANLLRGMALMAKGEAQEARLRFDRAKLTGGPQVRAEATLAAIEAALATRATTPKKAAEQLDALLLAWRGDAIERRALALAIRLADELHDPERMLAAGTMLFRYGGSAPGAAALLSRLQAQLAAVLSSDSKLPIDRAAGLFWDYRDITPAGVEGDRLVEALVARLQTAGLYARAADLLQHRLEGAPLDIERGPLGARIASLRILGGAPADAVRVLRATASTPYPPQIEADRRRIEAVALELIGKPAEALAVLDLVPGGAPIAAEIHWRRRDWAKLASTSTSALPSPAGRLSPVQQTIVLRQAIALAMLGREPQLAALRTRYAAGFAGLQTAPVFAMLTDQTSAIDPTALSKAMSALPAESPAGAIGELMDEGDAALNTGR